MSGVQILEVPADEADTRLDRWLHRRFPHVTQGQVQKFLRAGQIRVDGKRAEANTRVQPGQMVRVPPMPDNPAPAAKRELAERDAEAMRRMVLYRDEHVIAINKPAGLAVQGGTGRTTHVDGMLDALAFDGERPRLVHRLDADTSGVLLLARTRQAAQRLTGEFRERTTRKYYWAITIGVPQPHQGKIDAALLKGPGRAGERMQLNEEGPPATTLYQVVDHAVKAAWVALWPLTGRTHQLRAHMEAIGTPILGDEKYSRKNNEIDLTSMAERLHLHARRLIVPHPAGRGTIDVSAPLPDDLRRTWKYFGFDSDDGDPFAGLK